MMRRKRALGAGLPLRSACFIIGSVKHLEPIFFILPAAFRGLPAGIFIGVASTAIMDGLATVQDRFGFINKPSLALLGRWVFEVFSGHFRQAPNDIRGARPRRYETSVGLMAHYAIGSVLGVGFYSLFRLDTFTARSIAAIGYGFATNLFPWLIMFPSMGFGFFARNTLPEVRLFRTSLVNHLNFGVGLALSSAFLISSLV